MYIAGINAAPQEALSTTQGVGINLAIEYYRVLLCSSETTARYICMCSDRTHDIYSIHRILVGDWDYILCTKQFVGNDSVSLGCLVVDMGDSRLTGGDLVW